MIQKWKSLAVLILAGFFLGPVSAATPERIQKTITANAESDDLNTARWLAFRHAQYLLAGEMPSVVRFESQQVNGNVETEIHKILAQFTDSELVNSEFEAVYAPNTVAGELDEYGYPSGTLYRVKSTYKFNVIPAYQIDRAMALSENSNLRRQLKDARSIISNPEQYIRLTRQPMLPLDMLDMLEIKNGSSPALMAERAVSLGLDKSILGVDMDGKSFAAAFEKAEELYAKRRAMLTQADKIEADKRALYASVDRFVGSLPQAFANTMRVESAEHEITQLTHTFGWDFFISNKQLLTDFAKKYGVPYRPSKLPIEKVTLRIQTGCKLSDKLSDNPTVCDIWNQLPVEYRNMITANRGPYSGDQFDNFIHSVMTNPQAVTRMPVTNHGWRVPASRGYGSEGVYHREYGTDKPRKGTFSLKSVYRYTDGSVVPDVIAAGFVGKERVMLSVLFPLTKQYVDIPLTSDLYLLQPKHITLYLAPEETTEIEMRKRGSVIKTLVYIENDQLHPAEKEGYQEIKGDLHYANLAKISDDSARYEHLRWLVQYSEFYGKNISSPVSNPTIDKGVMNMGACTSGYTDCTNHLILHFGKVPALKINGIKHFVEAPINNPMNKQKECWAQTGFNTAELASITCKAHFSDPLNLIRPAGHRYQPSTANFWDDINGNPPGVPLHNIDQFKKQLINQFNQDGEIVSW